MVCRDQISYLDYRDYRSNLKSLANRPEGADPLAVGRDVRDLLNRLRIRLLPFRSIPADAEQELLGSSLLWMDTPPAGAKGARAASVLGIWRGRRQR